MRPYDLVERASVRASHVVLFLLRLVEECAALLVAVEAVKGVVQIR